MPRKSDELWEHYLEQLPVVAAMLFEDGTPKEAAAHAAEIIEACYIEACDLERP